jgi:hydrogenase nickel incorporation protein HypA/HybF
MHELSLALDTIELVTREARKNKVSRVLEIHVEVGMLSGVEAGAFDFALKLSSGGSILENAQIRLIRTPGNGYCSSCQKEFLMNGPLDACPGCDSHPSEIRGGREFRILSIVAE